MTEYHNLTDEQAERAIDKVQRYLPDDAKLLQLSFTGGRAFGWGPDNTDIDMRGYFAKDDWFKTCHVADTKDQHDFTLKNVYDIDNPEIVWRRWKHFYDFSKTVYINEKWDQEWYMNQVDVDSLTNEYPHSTKMQMNRMFDNFQARSVCHTYKEIMIPLHWLRTGEIESNVVKLSERGEFDVDGLEQAATVYKETNAKHTDEGIDKELVHRETKQLFNELGEELASQTNQYTHEPFFE